MRCGELQDLRKLDSLLWEGLAPTKLETEGVHGPFMEVCLRFA